MPYLHLDLPRTVDREQRADLAVRLAHVYADVMQTSPERVTVADVLETELDWPRGRTILEFTDRAGNEVWRSTELGNDWSPAEAAAGGADGGR